jgi:phosphoglycerate-specific signal transduction histidine kinase
VLTTKVPWKDSQGQVVGLIGISRDITERKQAEDQLRRAYTELAQNEATLKRTLQELKAAHEELKATELQLIQAAKLECIGTLAAGIAHEVKNPLQTMLMGLQYLTHKVPANHEGIALALHDMQDAVTRANAILRGLLELSADTKFGTKPEDLIWPVFRTTIRNLIQVNQDLQAEGTTISSRIRSKSNKLGSFTN